jgi:hypothetical protein
MVKSTVRTVYIYSTNMLTYIQTVNKGVFECVASFSDDKTDQKISNLISLIDDDELNLVFGEVCMCARPIPFDYM